ncbi:hypothetical protein [Nocardiopsis baichengensis]|uniref:hypothetical protein n=1 Tax=Nocardiopsis baichengensis TaxID=280240 RepID=UPI00034A0006|nr:hypothetical protein [Nocardiopsis baichengensis]
MTVETVGHGPLQALRTALLAASCTAVAWAGHAVWGGAPVPAWAPLSAAALLAGPLARFTRGRRGFGEIFAVLAAAQLPVHLLFLAAGSAHPAPEAALGAPAVHGAHAAHGGPSLFGYTPGMLAGHLWAALAGAALLSRGEDALWGLLGMLTWALPPLIAPAAVPAPPAARTAPGAPERGVRYAPRSGIRPRGPPLRS